MSAQRDTALDLLKWLAFLCMVLDHLRYVGWSLEYLYIPGRLAFPWFCLAIAANLARRPKALLPARYLVSLLIFSLLSEVPYRMFVYPAATLNVMPTLALGLLLAYAWQRGQRLLAGLILLGAVLASHWLMFGWPGVLLPAVLLSAQSQPRMRAVFGAAFAGILCLAGNAWEALFDAARYLNFITMGGALACLVGPGLGLSLLRHRLRWQAPPIRRWGYAFYPLHFLLLLGLRVLISASKH